MYSKELIKGTLEVIVLRLLCQNQRMYGYEIAQRVKEVTDSKILIKEGSLYPALHKLKSDGLVSIEEVSIGKRVRKYYRLTAKGESKKDILLAQLDDFLKTIRLLVFDNPNTSIGHDNG